MTVKNVKGHKPGPLGRREARLAWIMLAPTLLTVLAVVLFPVAADFWISFKPVQLGDLRAPEPFVSERVRGAPKAAGDQLTVEYRLRNSSTQRPVRSIVLRDAVPTGLSPVELDERCVITGKTMACDLGDWRPGYRERLRISFVVGEDWLAAPEQPRDTPPFISGESDNVLTNFEFTLDNFARVFEARSFWEVLKVSLIYTIFGTLGAIVLGLFAAQLLNVHFHGRAILRGFFLFPYVSPVIAVSFTWIFLLDPFSGAINALLLQLGTIATPINFLGQRDASFDVFGLSFSFPLALTTVIAFESWRYFPMAFLFILARLQALPSDLYEAAEMDGASPLQQFRFITLPQLIGIMSVLFLLRFIWTFNKFDDIFLLTGGAAGTRTLTVDVYEQGFALANLGAGAAVSVVIFMVLAIFVTLYFRFAPQEEGI